MEGYEWGRFCGLGLEVGCVIFDYILLIEIVLWFDLIIKEG